MSVATTIEKHAEAVAFVDEMGRPEWLSKRREGIGGSDAASVLGLGWRSPYSVWADKTGQIDDADAATMRMRCGQLMEPVIGTLFEEETGIVVQRHPYILRSREWPHMMVNLDFVADTPEAAIEAKTADFSFRDQWEDEDGKAKIPDAYMIQGQHELAVTGLNRVYFGVLIGGNDFRVIRVERDDHLIENLAEAEGKFWDLVLRLEAPEVDSSKSTADTLRAIYPASAPGSKVELPSQATEVIHRFLTAKAHLSEAKNETDLYGNQLKAMLGEAEVGLIDGVPAVTWKSHTVKEHVRKESVSRPLTIKL